MQRVRRRTRQIYLAWIAAAFVLLAAGWLALAGARDAPAAQAYVEGVLGHPDRINPLFAASDSPDADLVALLFSGLIRIAPDGAPLPDLAEAWDVTPDGLAYTFRLGTGVFWHDGQPLTANDVAFTIALLQDPGFRGPPALAAEWAGVTTEVPDDRTLIVRLPAASASFLTRAALGVLPRHLLAGLEGSALYDDEFNQKPVGSGPFRLVTLERNRAHLEPHASYHLGPPRLGALDLRFFDGESALAAALERREVNAALLPETGGGPAREAAAARPDLALSELPRANYTVLYLNNQVYPLNDPRVRRAFAAAIDRGTLLEQVFGGAGSPGEGPIVPASWAYSTIEAASLANRLAEADALLNASGWVRADGNVRVRNGQRLELELITNTESRRVRLAESVAAQLRAAGIGIYVSVQPSAQVLQHRLQPRDYDLAIFGWDASADPDPYGAWHTSQMAGLGRNFAGWHDPEADALLEQGRATLDVADRIDLYGRFSARFAELAPSIVLHYPTRTYAHPPGLEGLEGGLLFTPSDRFRDARRWRLVP